LKKNGWVSEWERRHPAGGMPVNGKIPAGMPALPKELRFVALRFQRRKKD
jgi:hypothetical protein